MYNIWYIMCINSKLCIQNSIIKITYINLMLNFILFYYFNNVIKVLKSLMMLLNIKALVIGF